MPRVLFVHHRPQLGGAVHSLELLITGLAPEWEPHVLLPEGAAAERFRAAGATVHTGPVSAFVHTWDVQYRGRRWLVLGRELGALPTHLTGLRRTLERVRPDIVHVNDAVMLAAGAVAHHWGAPVVWHLRSSLATAGTDGRSRWISRRLDAWGSAAVAIDSDVASTFRLAIPVEVVANAVVTDQEPARDLGVPSGHLAVGLIGYLRRQKGWPEFLAALRLLLDEGKPVHGVIVGGGVRPAGSFEGRRGRLLALAGISDEEGAYLRELDRLDLNAHVTTLPYSPSLGGIYRALDVVTFPNQGSGLGRPVLEAAAYGKPAVASGSPAGAGILLPGITGLLLEVADPPSIAEAISRLFDPALRRQLGTAARAHAEATFSPRASAGQVAAVFERVLAEPRPGR